MAFRTAYVVVRPLARRVRRCKRSGLWRWGPTTGGSRPTVSLPAALLAASIFCVRLSGSLATRYSDCSGFRPIFGQSWPQDPSRTTGLVLQCRLHQKSALQINAKAISWQFGILKSPPPLNRQKCVFLNCESLLPEVPRSLGGLGWGRGGGCWLILGRFWCLLRARLSALKRPYRG